MNIMLRQEVNNVQRGIIVFDVIIITILLFSSFLDKSKLVGLLFGSIIAILQFRLSAISISRGMNMFPEQARIYIMKGYGIRMIINLVVLLVGMKSQHIDGILVFLGLTSTRFVILAQKLLIDKLIRKEA